MMAMTIKNTGHIHHSLTVVIHFLPKKLENKNIYRAASNLPKVKALRSDSLNVEDVAKYKNVLIEQKAIESIK